MTTADAAKLVKREVPVTEGGKPKIVPKTGKPAIREVAVKADEVLSFRDYGDRVVVVTTDGQKLTGKQ